MWYCGGPHETFHGRHVHPVCAIVAFCCRQASNLWIPLVIPPNTPECGMPCSFHRHNGVLRVIIRPVRPHRASPWAPKHRNCCTFPCTWKVCCTWLWGPRYALSTSHECKESWQGRRSPPPFQKGIEVANSVRYGASISVSPDPPTRRRR